MGKDGSIGGRAEGHKAGVRLLDVLLCRRLLEAAQEAFVQQLVGVRFPLKLAQRHVEFAFLGGVLLNAGQSVFQRGFLRPGGRDVALQPAHRLAGLVVDLAIDFLDLRLEIHHRRVRGLVSRGKLRLLMHQLRLVGAQLLYQRRIEHRRGIDASGANLGLKLAEAGLLLRAIGPGEDQLGIELRKLLLVERRTLGFGQVVLLFEQLDGALRIANLLSQIAQLIVEPGAGPLGCVELGLDLVQQIEIDIAIGDHRGGDAIGRLRMDFDQVRSAVVGNLHARHQCADFSRLAVLRPRLLVGGHGRRRRRQPLQGADGQVIGCSKPSKIPAWPMSS